MFGSTMLDVAIGMAVLYSFLSLLVSTARETVEALYNSRGRTLERAIREMVGDEATAKVYSHPVIASLFIGEYRKLPDRQAKLREKALSHGERIAWRHRPSYIPSRHFAIALLDVVGGSNGSNAGSSVVALAQTRRTATSSSSQAAKLVVSAIDAAQLDPNRTIEELQGFYDGAMDRTSGRYKRWTQAFVLIASVMIAVYFNIDSIAIANHLYRTPATRDALVAGAGSFETIAAQSPALNEIVERLHSMQLPIGYSASVSIATRLTRALHSPLGYVVTILAISLGAPFWFDLLNKMMVIRSTVKPREKSREEGSEDRSAKTDVPSRVGPAPVGGVPAGRREPQIRTGPDNIGTLTCRASGQMREDPSTLTE